MTTPYLEKPLRSEAEARSTRKAIETLAVASRTLDVDRFRYALAYIRGYAQGSATLNDGPAKEAFERIEAIADAVLNGGELFGDAK